MDVNMDVNNARHNGFPNRRPFNTKHLLVLSYGGSWRDARADVPAVVDIGRNYGRQNGRHHWRFRKPHEFAHPQERPQWIPGKCTD